MPGGGVASHARRGASVCSMSRSAASIRSVAVVVAATPSARSAARSSQSSARATSAQRAYAYLTAGTRFEAALAVLEGRGADPAERGWLLLRLARMRRFAAPRQALTATAEAARLGAAVGDCALLMACQFTRGLLLCYVGDLREGLVAMAAAVDAQAAFSPAERDRLRTHVSDLGAAYDEHHYRGTLAQCLTYAGRFAEAAALARRYAHVPTALASASNAGGSSYADAQAALALLHAALGRPAAARRAFARAVDAYRAVGNLNSVMATLSAELDWRVLPFAADGLAERHRLQAAVVVAWEQARGAYAAASADEPQLALLLVVNHRP